MRITYCPKCEDYHLAYNAVAMSSKCDRCGAGRHFINLTGEEEWLIKSGEVIPGEEDLTKESQNIIEKVRKYYINERQIWEKIK